MTLHTRTVGQGTRIVLAHGFTQNDGCWGPFAEVLAEQFEVVMVDAPGHGRSNHDHADLVEAGRLLAEVGGDAHYVGYSMGGRMLLHAALHAPVRMRSLSLIGATPGIEDAAERATRRSADEALADRLLAQGLARFLDDWLALPLFENLSTEMQCREQRLENRVEGLAASLRSCGTGTQEPLWDRLEEIDTPTLVMAGDADRKFSDLGRRMADSLPKGTFWTTPGGHAVHSESPVAVAARISEFVRSVES